MHEGLHPKSSVDRLNISRKEGGTGLLNVEDTVHLAIIGSLNYVGNSEEILLNDARQALGHVESITLCPMANTPGIRIIVTIVTCICLKTDLYSTTRTLKHAHAQVLKLVEQEFLKLLVKCSFGDLHKLLERLNLCHVILTHQHK